MFSNMNFWGMDVMSPNAGPVRLRANGAAKAKLFLASGCKSCKGSLEHGKGAHCSTVSIVCLSEVLTEAARSCLESEKMLQQKRCSSVDVDILSARICPVWELSKIYEELDSSNDQGLRYVLDLPALGCTCAPCRRHCCSER